MPEPEKLSDEDIEGALSGAASDVDEIGDLAEEVLGELARRIKDPKLRKELPGTGLIQLAKELVKAKKETPEEAEDANAYTSVLTIVRESTLPDERKKELLIIERARLEDELEQVRAELEEL